MMMLADTHPRSPFRKLDWRWLRAAISPGESARASRHDDDWVRRGRRLRKALDRAGGDTCRPLVAGADPTVLAAYRFWLGVDRRRWEVEARLLAGQDDPAIATRAGVPAEVVEAYASLFFDVRGRLGCSDWVTAMVLGHHLFEGLAPDDVELLWKVFGYHLGPLALDALVESPGSIQHAQAIDNRADASGSTAARLAIAVGALTLRVDQQSVPKLVRLASLVRTIESQAETRAASPVFAPIGLASRVSPGLASPIGAGSPFFAPALIGPIVVENTGPPDGDGDLGAIFLPLAFPKPSVSVPAFRRATA